MQRLPAYQNGLLRSCCGRSGIFMPLRASAARHHNASAAVSSLAATAARFTTNPQEPTSRTVVVEMSPSMMTNRRCFMEKITNAITGNKNRVSEKDAELQPHVYDKETVHYTGSIFGISTDSLFFYAKVVAIGLTIYVILWTFFAGYHYLASFSLASVGRLGFMAGFWTCAVLFSTAIQFKKRYTISPNAVYNQAIATVMKDEEVVKFLGAYPKTGDFRAYNATGGFKLPLLRRIRSGSYEISDLIGTKPQKLQMMFVLRHENREALVSCDVRKMHATLLTSKYQFHSLAVHLKDQKTKEEPKSLVLIGRDEDVIYKGFMKF